MSYSICDPYVCLHYSVYHDIHNKLAGDEFIRFFLLIYGVMPFTCLISNYNNSFSRYIERFRHGRPQSREVRQQMSAMVGEGQQPFWWLSSSPLPSSSTPTQTTDKGTSLCSFIVLYISLKLIKSFAGSIKQGI